MVPNHGENTPVHQLVNAPSPGSVSAMSVIAPSTSSVSPMIERTTSGVSRAVSPSRGFGRRARDALVAGLRAVERRRVATSDFHDHGEDHGPPLRLLIQEARERVLDLRVEQGDLADVVAWRVDGLRHPLERLLHDRVLLVQMDEAPRDDLGLADDGARLLVDGHDDEEHAVIRECPTIAQHDVPDVADRQPVDVDVAGGHRRGPAGRSVRRELDRRAVLDDEHVLRGDAGLDREPAVLDLHPELAVHWDEVLRLGQTEHQLELFLAGVARDVGALDGVVVDVRPGLEQVVDGARDRLLVAWDRAGADDDGVARLYLYESMVAVGHPRESGHRLALCARRR